jgi:hypothetical protein
MLSQLSICPTSALNGNVVSDLSQMGQLFAVLMGGVYRGLHSTRCPVE